MPETPSQPSHTYRKRSSERSGSAGKIVSRRSRAPPRRIRGLSSGPVSLAHRPVSATNPAEYATSASVRDSRVGPRRARASTESQSTAPQRRAEFVPWGHRRDGVRVPLAPIRATVPARSAGHAGADAMGRRAPPALRGRAERLTGPPLARPASGVRDPAIRERRPCDPCAAGLSGRRSPPAGCRDRTPSRARADAF